MKSESKQKMNEVVESVNHPIINPETGRVIPKNEMIKDITDFINGTYKGEKIES